MELEPHQLYTCSSQNTVTRLVHLESDLRRGWLLQESIPTSPISPISPQTGVATQMENSTPHRESRNSALGNSMVNEELFSRVTHAINQGICSDLTFDIGDSSALPDV